MPESPISKLFARFGSGWLARQQVITTSDAIRNVEQEIAATPKTKRSFNLEQLGNKILFTFDDSGFILKVYSAVPGNGFRWVGQATPSAPIFDLFMPEDNHVDRQRFLDYVFNFKHVLVDLVTGHKEVVDKDDVAGILLANATSKPAMSLRVLRAALGG
jgi:hypothetical protein